MFNWGRRLTFECWLTRPPSLLLHLSWYQSISPWVQHPVCLSSDIKMESNLYSWTPYRPLNLSSQTTPFQERRNNRQSCSFVLQHGVQEGLRTHNRSCEELMFELSVVYLPLSTSLFFVFQRWRWWFVRMQSWRWKIQTLGGTLYRFNDNQF